MGLFGKLFGGRDKAAVHAAPETFVLRDATVARTLRMPTAPNFSDDPQAPCETCGRPVVETFITTGGAGSDPDVWREHPIAVDGWACAACGVLRYPRKIEPARITELSREGVAHGSAGRFAEAELCFARIVWNWPGYIAGHLNLAEATSERLKRAAPEDPQTRRRIRQRMLDQYEAAIDAYAKDATPPEAAGSIANACIVVAQAAIADRSYDRARRFFETCATFAGVPAPVAAAGRRGLDYLTTRQYLFDEAATVLRGRIGLSDRPAKPPTTSEERTAMAHAIEQLDEHLALAPDRWQAAWLRAKALHLVGRDDDAFQAWRLAFERFGSQREIAQDYGMALLLADRITEAREVGRAITAQLPNDGALWCNLAVSELLCGDLDAAERALARSKAVDPRDAIAKRLEARVRQYREGKPLPKTIRELEHG